MNTQELNYIEAFKLAERSTNSKSRQVNAHWLYNNGYYKQRIMRKGVRTTYYIKMK